ncbi:MAG TPA: hypothetical protein VN730_05935 [Steroidobacteraceae bacterium]|nr:hypothetical protein [Steroidobacteraceae bacterium]
MSWGSAASLADELPEALALDEELDEELAEGLAKGLDAELLAAASDASPGEELLEEALDAPGEAAWTGGPAMSSTTAMQHAIPIR